MASPFRLFRRYQKALLVVAGVILMFVFVVGDSLMQYVGSRARDNDENRQQPQAVAVSWDGGELTNAELFQLVMQRVIVNAFVRTVEYAGREAAYNAGIEPQPLTVEAIIGPERPQENVERDVVRTRIFADAARAEGMSISDEYVLGYLHKLGRGQVTADMLRQIIGQLQLNGRPVTVDFVLDALREEMLSRNYLASYTFALDTVTPEQRYADWLRANDRVVVEAAALPTESFVVDVPDPTDAELTAFYDQYKNREASPERVGGLELPSAIPGFAKPRKVDLQYLRADFNKFLEKVEGEVTDAEIEKFYEDNKDLMFSSAGSLLDPTTPETDANKTDSAGSGEQQAPAAAGEQAPAGGETPAPKEGDQSSSGGDTKSNVFRLTAFQQDGNGAAAAESTSSQGSSAESEATSDVEVSDAFPTNPSDEAPKEYQPLDEVRDEIRRQIAEVKVSDQLEKLVEQVERELNEKYTNYFGQVLDADAEGKPAPPPPDDLADLTALAEKHGLDYQKTGPISFLEMRQLPIGFSAQVAAGNVPLIASVFGKEMELYQPIATFDLDNNRYIAMKTSDTPGSVPPLAEIRDEVVRAYKLQKAADLALARAKEDAKKIQDGGASLEAFFANDSAVKVVKTDPFSFLTIGNISRDTQQVQSFRLSEPEGIAAAGPDFMKTVFSLGDGEVGAVLNHDHSNAYVVKVAEHVDTPAKLRQDFLGEADTWYGLPIMGREHAQLAVRVLLDDMLKSADVDWKRPPDAMSEPTDEEEGDEPEADAEADTAESSDASNG